MMLSRFFVKRCETREFPSPSTWYGESVYDGTIFFSLPPSALLSAPQLLHLSIEG